jgi:hypothetical protein
MGKDKKIGNKKVDNKKVIRPKRSKEESKDIEIEVEVPIDVWKSKKLKQAKGTRRRTSVEEIEKLTKEEVNVVVGFVKNGEGKLVPVGRDIRDATYELIKQESLGILTAVGLKAEGYELFWKWMEEEDEEKKKDIFKRIEAIENKLIELAEKKTSVTVDDKIYTVDSVSTVSNVETAILYDIVNRAVSKSRDISIRSFKKLHGDDTDEEVTKTDAEVIN